jgi:DNA-binding NtrC family response regulator
MSETIRLLMVDDEVEFLDSLAERLEQRGFSVFKAYDAEQALALAERERFDLAVVDLRMPGMDGQALLETLKREHKYLEVVILTGFGTVESAFECSRLGAFGYLAKPFDLDKLLNVLKDAFAERMRKKFQHEQERAQKLAELSLGASPLGILRAMKELDDQEK